MSRKRGKGPTPLVSAPAVKDSKCMGCMDRYFSTSQHDCGGDKILPEQGWRCVCPLPECRRRQNGNWTGKSHARLTTRR